MKLIFDYVHPFVNHFCFRKKVREFMHDLASNLWDLSPLVRLAAKRAALTLAITAEISERMILCGRLPRDQVLKTLSECDVASYRGNWNQGPGDYPKDVEVDLAAAMNGLSSDPARFANEPGRARTRPRVFQLETKEYQMTALYEDLAQPDLQV